jgi:hypothetical protein
VEHLGPDGALAGAGSRDHGHGWILSVALAGTEAVGPDHPVVPSDHYMVVADISD